MIWSAILHQRCAEKDYRTPSSSRSRWDSKILSSDVHSGTTGKTQGRQQRTVGTSLTSRALQDYQEIHRKTVYVHAGHRMDHRPFYIVYGPLTLGATSVLYEGVPQFPEAGGPGYRRTNRRNIFPHFETRYPYVAQSRHRRTKKHPPFKHMTTVGNHRTRSRALDHEVSAKAKPSSSKPGGKPKRRLPLHHQPISTR